MRNKTAGEVVAEVLMLSSVDKGRAFLIVEGKDDWKFWKPRVHTACEVVDATGKNEGVAAIRRLNSRGFVGHVGVFDRDYRDALTESSWQRNEIYWDAHSLETVLFYSTAFERALVEHADRAKRDVLEGQIGRPLRDVVESVARAIGAVRYIHHLSGSDSDASKLAPGRYLKSDPFGFDEEGMLTVGVEIGAAPSIPQLRARVAQYATIDIRLLIRGHDVSAIAAWLIRCCGGTCGYERIEQVFRLSFQTTELERTTVYRELREWERARVPRRVLQ
jgi:hypothetical protein